MKSKQIDLALHERLKEIDIENRFFNTLEAIGFTVKRSVFRVLDNDLHYIKHYSLPLHCSFQCDLKTMTITYLSIEHWSWVEAKEKGKPIMSCENFIKWQTCRVRELTREILMKLYNKAP